MPINPKFTVYIASYNYGRYLKQAIKSVLDQTEKNWELLLINDGSTDNTKKIFSSYKKKENIKIFNIKNSGLPYVCNLAISKAKGKYIIRLDGDDYFDENILTVLGKYLDDNKNIGAVFPDYFFVDKNSKIISYEWNKNILHSKDSIIPPNGACTLFRTSLLRNVGGYREDLGAQDGLDLFLKIKDSFDVNAINLPLFYYRRHGKNLTEQSVKIFKARRKIKLDNSLEKIKENSPIIAVIPCRSSYDFIDNLWSQKIGRRTLLERDIETCVASKIFDKIVVTCDNDDPKKIVNKFKYDRRVIFLPRSKKLTSKSSNISLTIKKILNKYDTDLKGIVLMRYIQTPFINHHLLEEAISTLVLSKSDSSIGLEKMHHDLFQNKKSSYNLLAINDKSKMKINSNIIYKDSSTCIAFKSKNIKKGFIRGNKINGFEVTSVESFFINSLNDLFVARNIFLNNVSK